MKNFKRFFSKCALFFSLGLPVALILALFFVFKGPREKDLVTIFRGCELTDPFKEEFFLREQTFDLPGVLLSYKSCPTPLANLSNGSFLSMEGDIYHSSYLSADGLPAISLRKDRAISSKLKALLLYLLESKTLKDKITAIKLEPLGFISVVFKDNDIEISLYFDEELSTEKLDDLLEKYKKSQLEGIIYSKIESFGQKEAYFRKS